MMNNFSWLVRIGLKAANMLIFYDNGSGEVDPLLPFLFPSVAYNDDE
jgi:hypothetical protein